MSSRDDAARYVREWVRKAENDLRNAEHTLTLESDCPFDTVCFHAQQCAEKYLKALLVHRGSSPPKIHDLTELFPLVQQNGSIDIDHRDTELLVPYAVEPRYPVNWEPITREDAEKAVEAAKRVRAAVRSVLPEEALGSRQQACGGRTVGCRSYFSVFVLPSQKARDECRTT